MAELIAQEKDGSLSVEEKSELDHIMNLGTSSAWRRREPDRSLPVAHDVDDVSRRLVMEPAARHCELLGASGQRWFSAPVDHIICRKHGGSSGVGCPAITLHASIQSWRRAMNDSRRSVFITTLNPTATCPVERRGIRAPMRGSGADTPGSHRERGEIARSALPPSL